MNSHVEEEIINKTINFIRKELKKSDVAHDFWHHIRVWKLAKYISKKESKKYNINQEVIEIASLIHDIVDRKVNGENAANKIMSFLRELKIKENEIKKIIEIIQNISFHKQKEVSKKNKGIKRSIEFMIVQDADRLDALGAIGIARTFSYGGHKRIPIYIPREEIKEDKFIRTIKYAKIKNSKSTIDHFYEKLLLLKDLMNTETAKKIAEKRHKFMLRYLKEFFKEHENLK